MDSFYSVLLFRIAAYGIGYAWNPSTLEIKAGDLVAFSWSFPDLVEGSKTVGLFTTSDPSSEEYDGVGFEAQPAALGKGTSPISR